MVDGLKPYPNYKSSRLPWLGRIPAHWEEHRAKEYFREIDERSQTGEEEMLSVSHLTGVTPRRQKNVTMFEAESYVGHKLCHQGDLVINTMWAWMAALGVARQTGVVSPSYGVYRPVDGQHLSADYVDVLLRTEPYRSEYVCRSTGIRSSRFRLYPDKFLDIPIACPPREEQDQIVRFIAAQDQLVRRFISAKKKQVLAVRELCRAMTEEAARAPQTKSMRLGVVTTIVERPVERESDHIYTPIGLFNRGRGMFHKESTRGADLGDSSFYWIEEGDLVISGQFAWEGAVALARPQDSGCVVSHRYPVLLGRGDMISCPFLLAFFRTQFGTFLLDQHSRGAAGRNRPLNVRTLLKEKIPVPAYSEQCRIAEIVHLEAEMNDSFIRTAQAIREYWNDVLADLVTGKLDVRQAMIGDEVPLIADRIDESDEDLSAGIDESEVPEEAAVADD